MSVPVIPFFNNKGAVSHPWRRKTIRRSRKFLIPSATTRKASGRHRWSTISHGCRRPRGQGGCRDLDPQANLTAAFVDDDELERLWNSGDTIYGLIEPLIKGIGDVRLDGFSAASGDLVLLPGDLRLSTLRMNFHRSGLFAWKARNAPFGWNRPSGVSCNAARKLTRRT